MNSALPISQRSSNAVPETRRLRGSRRNNSTKALGKPQPAYPVFNWQSAVEAGTEPRYLRQSADVNKALEFARGPFGFDVEWKPNFVKGHPQSPIALLQLAKEDQILLIQLSAMNEFPQRLQEVLEDPDIVKAGVGIIEDAKKLWRDYGVSLLGAVELSYLARSADSSRWANGKLRELISLTRLLEAYRSRSLNKGKTRMSNWESPLTKQQINYAASDALAGYIVYQDLINLNSDTPPETYTSDILAGEKMEPTSTGVQAQQPM